MKLYLTGYTMKTVTFESIENGYEKLVLEREAWWMDPNEIPDAIRVDYWETFEE